MSNLKFPEILVLLLIVLLLFGARRLPDAARGLGRSLRIFKSEVSAMNEDPDKSDAESSDTQRSTSDSSTDKPAAKDSTSTTDSTDR